MPWRALPGETADPYRVWLSEAMLQQTTVAAVIPYYERFVSRFPDLAALAAAEEGAVMEAWAGLGYYARARNLAACARRVAAMGGFPRDLAGLRGLPGIGAYTAAAIGAIAFGLAVVPVDGNVERVAARLAAIEAPLPGARGAIAAVAARLGEDAAARARPGDFAQALFDLGAGVCTKAAPGCAVCPWRAGCAGRLAGIAAVLPRKAAKRARPERFGVHFWLEDGEGRVLLRRRPSCGLLGGMLELPGPAWRGEAWGEAEALAAAPARTEWRHVGTVRHGFTHFSLTIEVYAGLVGVLPGEGVVVARAALAGAALPSVMRKCVGVVGGGAGRLMLGFRRCIDRPIQWPARGERGARWDAE